MTGVHDSAAKGYQTSANAYQKGRPDYSPKILEWLRDDLSVSRNSIIVDLGAGTGKFTQRLCEISNNVIGVEPVDAMREQLAHNLQQVQTLKGTATAMPHADASVDFVICAQAFHWFATKQTMAEIHRILKPGGRLGLVWNVRDENTDWVAELTKIVTPYEGDAPRYYKGDWRNVFPATGFTDLHSSSFAHAHFGSPEDVIINRFMSVSFVAAQDAATRKTIEEEMRTLIAKHPALIGKTELAFPYVTECFWCEKTY
ncbi:class I SAM-dependent methyltransferase [Maritalea sp.]|jgi:ubiquinone/menaquinone biosynthesis C-methylase UbiE|uniref:class I SAM-dependent methyltransferase n=1 Tax=Maritalea sp. TaxID=2003361 RepID=UPI0039E68DAF